MYVLYTLYAIRNLSIYQERKPRTNKRTNKRALLTSCSRSARRTSCPIYSLYLGTYLRNHRQYRLLNFNQKFKEGTLVSKPDIPTSHIYGLPFLSFIYTLYNPYDRQSDSEEAHGDLLHLARHDLQVH